MKKIRIKKNKVGTFTAAAKKHGKSVLAFASQVLANKENYSPAMVKKANFARNAVKWHGEGGPLNLWEQVLGRDLTELELLNVRLKRTPWGTPLELGLKEVHPELLVLPSGGASKAANLGISTGKKFITKSLRMLKTLENASETVANKADEAVYRGIEKVRDTAIEKFPLYGKSIWEAGKGLKHGHKVAKELSMYPAFLYNNTSDNINDNMETVEPPLKPLKEGLLEYAFGGELTHGGVFSNNVLKVNEGGTHLENPYGGILLGVDEQGIPNLVEEGELIWNDYVFSNRLKVPKAVRLKYKLRGNKELSFADAAKNILKESEERPNDPISLNGLDAALSRLAMKQELIRMKKEQRLNTFAYGGSKGNMFDGTGDKSLKLKTYRNYTLLPLNTDFYTPLYMNFWNWMDKNRDTAEAKNWLSRINSGEFGNIGGNTFNMDDIMRLSHDYKRGPVHNAFELASSDFERAKSLSNLGIFNLKAPTIKPITMFEEELPEEEEIKYTPSKSLKEFKESPLRYAPIVGHAAGVISDIFSKPDYLAADEVRNIELNPSLVGFTPLGNKLRFTPYDTNYHINKINANTGASRRNIMNTSGGNRAAAMAGLMGVDYNYTNALGDAYRQALEYNDKRREAVETFNRATDLYNSEMGLKAAMANAESRNAMTKARYERDKVAALLGQLARDAYNTRLSNNLNILLEDIGNLGKERNSRNWADILANRGVIKMNSKGEHLSKNGSKLNRKKKGGWEYA